MTGLFADIGACTEFRATGAAQYYAAALFPTFLFFHWLVRRQPGFFGKRYFLVANLAVIWWLFAVVMELFSVDPGCKMFWGTMAFAGIGTLPVAWFLFVYRFSRGETGPMLTWQRRLLVTVPTLIMLAAASNPLHGMFYDPASAPASELPGAPVIYEHRLLFYIAAGGLYVFLLAGYGLLAMGAKRARGLTRMLFVLLILLAAVPTAANVGYILFGVAIAGFDPTPFLFSAILVIFAALISVNRFFQLTTIAKDMVFDSLPNPVLVVGRDGQIMVANARAAEVFGIDMNGTPTVEDVPGVARLLAQSLETGEAPEGLPEINVDGRDYEVHATQIDGDTGMRDAAMGFAFLFFEITNRKSMQRQLASILLTREEELARMERKNRRIRDEVMTDPLTGLLNRRALAEEIGRLSEGPGRLEQPCAATVIDIDHFKSINDRFGHSAGDAALIAVATCLKDGFRKEDKVFRLGGEEFLILSPEIDLTTLYDRIDTLRGTIAEAAKTIPPGNMDLRFSAGVAVWPYDSATLSDAVAIADRRLYDAKNAGRDRTSGPLARAG